MPRETTARPRPTGAQDRRRPQVKGTLATMRSKTRCPECARADVIEEWTFVAHIDPVRLTICSVSGSSAVEALRAEAATLLAWLRGERPGDELVTRVEAAQKIIEAAK